MTSTKKQTSINEKRKCTCCGEPKNEKDYYISKSILNKAFGRLGICKLCISDIYDKLLKKYGNSKIATYELCRLLDMPFYFNVYEGAEKESFNTGTNIYQVYITKINSLGGANNYGDCFLDGDKFEECINNQEIIIYNNFEITSDLIRKWGNLSPQDIAFLEYEYKDWCTRYDVSSKAMEVNVKEICYQQLVIKQKRESSQPVDKELKSLGDLMGNSALKPIQETAAMSAEYNTLGTWIKKFEQEEPCPEPDPELKDVDGFKKYIKIWFLGHLCKILGIENEYSQEYDEELLKYTVNFEEDVVKKEGEQNDLDE